MSSTEAQVREFEGTVQGGINTGIQTCRARNARSRPRGPGAQPLGMRNPERFFPCRQAPRSGIRLPCVCNRFRGSSSAGVHRPRPPGKSGAHRYPCDSAPNKVPPGGAAQGEKEERRRLKRCQPETGFEAVRVSPGGESPVSVTARIRLQPVSLIFLSAFHKITLDHRPACRAEHQANERRVPCSRPETS